MTANTNIINTPATTEEKGIRTTGITMNLIDILKHKAGFGSLATKSKIISNEVSDKEYPEFQVGGFTDNIPVDQIAGVVHGNELKYRLI